VRLLSSFDVGRTLSAIGTLYRNEMIPYQL
jgi:hypothetical protein